MISSGEQYKATGQYELQPLLKAKDVAVKLWVSEKTVHKLAREGRLACVQVTARDRRLTHEQDPSTIRPQGKSPGAVIRFRINQAERPWCMGDWRGVR
jgi:predicted site-specific integrase-resolvase